MKVVNKMPYRMTSDGIGEAIEMLKQLEDKAEFVAAQALYEGAGIIADAVTAEAKTIKTAPFHYAAVEGATKRLPSPEEKDIVTAQRAMGVSKFRKRIDSVDTSVGYNGSGYVPVNWNHMSSKARTNYKQATFKGRDINASSTLKWLRDQGGSEKYGISKDIGKGAQNMKPIGVIANAINSGTSFMEKQPFIRRAFTKSRDKAEKAIVERVESLFNKIINESNVGGKTA